MLPTMYIHLFTIVISMFYKYCALYFVISTLLSKFK